MPPASLFTSHWSAVATESGRNTTWIEKSSTPTSRSASLGVLRRSFTPSKRYPGAFEYRSLSRIRPSASLMAPVCRNCPRMRRANPSVVCSSAQSWETHTNPHRSPVVWLSVPAKVTNTPWERCCAAPVIATVLPEDSTFPEASLSLHVKVSGAPSASICTL